MVLSTVVLYIEFHALYNFAINVVLWAWHLFDFTHLQYRSPLNARNTYTNSLRYLNFYSNNQLQAIRQAVTQNSISDHLYIYNVISN